MMMSQPFPMLVWHFRQVAGRWLGLAGAIASAVALGGCPSATPDSSKFATGATSAVVDGATLSDSGGLNGADGAQATGGGADGTAAAEVASGADSGPTPEVAQAQDAPADSGAKPLPCDNGAGLLEKTWNGGVDESLNGMVQTASGGAVFVGATGNGGSGSDGFAVRVSAQGAVVWAKTIGGAAADRLDGIAAAGDGFVAVGMTKSKGAGLGDGWLVRLDSAGKVSGEVTYGGSGDDAMQGVAATVGGFVLAGSNRSLGGGLEDGWLLLADPNGQKVWEAKYGGGQIDQFWGVAVTPGGRIAAAGSNMSSAKSGSDAWLLVAEADGTQVFSKTYHMGEYDEARAVIAQPSGGFVLTGTASNNGNPDLWVLGIGEDGTLLWSDLLTGNQTETGRAIAMWADGSFAVVGESSSSGANTPGGIDGWAIRYDAWGNRMWDKKFGTSGNEWLSAVAAIPDGGLWLGGRRFVGGGLDAWYLRVDPWGNQDCGGAGACKALGSAACDDSNPCTTDTCQPSGGCKHVALADGKVCGQALVCSAGKCEAP